MKKRRLSDLYVRGTEVTFNDDDSGDSVVVWLQKLNGVDRESCLRRAHAGRARYLADADDEQSELFQAMFGQIRAMPDREGLIGLIIAEDLARYRQRVEAELAADEEGWGKDNYVQGLVDSWLGDEDNKGLVVVKTEDPEDPEACRVNEELERFEREVIDKVKAENDRLKRDWGVADQESIWRKATQRMLDLRGNEIFSAEFERQQLFFSVREPEDHHQRYFATLQELDDLDDNVRETLISSYNHMMVDPTEGKDSRASQPSSNSSEPTSAGEAEQDSGLEAASA